MKKQLKFNSDGKFRIICFGDLHEENEFETENHYARFNDMQLLMKTAVERLRPDLAVFMGDMYCSDDMHDEMIAKIVKPVTDAGIPFAAVLGNHEHDREEAPVVNALINTPGSLCFNDDPDITGDLNYNLTIQASDGDKTVANLWFIDSNNLCPSANVSKYDWVHKDQIEWYERKAAELKEQNGGEPVPAVLFQHTPVTEENQALREAKPWELYQSVKGHYFRSNKRYVGNEKVIAGYVGEDPCVPQYNDGQFESWKKTGDVVAAFFGHDHLNDFTCIIDGIMMGQCKTAGFRCYTDGCQSSVRVVDIYENDPRNVKTNVIKFKEFGLKCTCLDPIKRNFNDKQNTTLTVLSRLAMGAAAAGAVAFAVKKLKGKKK